MPGWLIKFIVTKVVKAIKHKHDLKKIDDYVNKPNELDKQIKQVQKTMNKYGKYIERLEKEVAILRKDSHPPIFSKADLRKIEKRLRKLERKKEK
jgi:tRNA U34 5-carboxymethylaminomethyl modifying enzyme MnmG/GidA